MIHSIKKNTKLSAYIVYLFIYTMQGLIIYQMFTRDQDRWNFRRPGRRWYNVTIDNLLPRKVSTTIIIILLFIFYVGLYHSYSTLYFT